MMRKILGIDTGGTYTDAVVLAYEKKKVLDKNKVLTTPNNLVSCIRKVLEGLDLALLSEIEYVALSTTLATNAIVEGRGARTGLILLGYEKKYLHKFEFTSDIPTDRIRAVAGRFDIKGREQQSLDEAKLEKIAREWQTKVDSVGISGYMSVKNPAHELKAKEILQQKLNVPVLCGQTLSHKLNLIKRATTVTLNAGLIPLITDLTKGVKNVLSTMNIDVPLMIVKGDGSLAPEEEVLLRPIETIMSGPAASVTGAKYLTEVKDAIIVDMGGTTTDIAILEDGRPNLSVEGAKVGKWQTSIASLDLRTAGIGGDSEINLTKKGELKIGPRRIIPLAKAAEEHQNLVSELKRVKEEMLEFTYTQFLLLAKDKTSISYSRREQQIINLLKTGPKSLALLKEELDLIDLKFLRSDRLERLDIVKRTGLTPTDVLHALGKLNLWQSDVAKLGFLILKDRIRLDVSTSRGHNQKAISEDFLIKKVKEKIALEIGRHVLQKANTNLNKEEQNKLLRVSFQEYNQFNLDFNFANPIVALGAPAEAFLQQLQEFFSGETIIPGNFEVANAIGAAAAQMFYREEILVKKVEGDYVIFHSNGPEEFSSYSKAKKMAAKRGREILQNKFAKAEIESYKIDCSQEQENFDELVITRIICEGRGDPLTEN